MCQLTKFTNSSKQRETKDMLVQGSNLHQIVKKTSGNKNDSHTTAEVLV
jgi:hypothetical protein